MKLTEYGITPAPILYALSTATTIPQLVRDFYGTVLEFKKGGPDVYSSILLDAVSQGEREREGGRESVRESVVWVREGVGA